MIQFHWLSLRLAMVVTTVLSAGSAVSGEGGDERILSASLTLGSDYVFRGVSQTLGAAAVQASISADLESGVYAYVWMSNVDFVPDGEPDDEASLEVNAAIGFDAELTDDWSLDAMLIRYAFPDAIEGAGYDYDELVASLWFRERLSATIAWSPDVFGSGDDGLLVAVGARRELPADVSLAAVCGYYDLSSAYGSSYAYVNVAVSRPIAFATTTLAYHDTFGGSEALFYEQTTGSRLVLSFDIEF